MQGSFLLKWIIMCFQHWTMKFVVLLRIFSISDCPHLHRNHRLALMVKQYSETSAVSASVIEIVYTCFRVYPYFSRVHGTLRESLDESLIFLCHMFIPPLYHYLHYGIRDIRLQ